MNSLSIFISIDTLFKNHFLKWIKNALPTSVHWEDMLCTEIDFVIHKNLCVLHVLPMFCKNKSFWQRCTCTIRCWKTTTFFWDLAIILFFKDFDWSFFPWHNFCYFFNWNSTIGIAIPFKDSLSTTSAWHFSLRSSFRYCNCSNSLCKQVVSIDPIVTRFT